MGPGLTILLVVIGLVIVIALWYIGIMNKLRQLELKVHEAESGIDVALTKRFDVLSKMLETTKGYAKHEAETLEKVIKWRQGVPANATLKDKEEFLGQMNKVASGINVVVEQYPNLKADGLFKDLQASDQRTPKNISKPRAVCTMPT
ncbi:MAG: LemA family protein [Bacillus subtilis]|nr:LemA family protein [Bacillus subtilis]